MDALVTIKRKNTRRLDYMEIAETFGRKVWPYKIELKIEDLMLYGSLTYGKETPSDIDIMLIHNENSLFEEMQKIGKSENRRNIDIFHNFRDFLSKKGGFDISFLLGERLLIKSIEEDILNVNFLDKKIFIDEKYKSIKIGENKDPNFYNIIFDQGLLWDGNKYSINAKNKYKFSNSY